MKKILSFITALLIFVTAALSAHAVTSGNLDANNADFAGWINTKKDLSYSAISSNIEDDTVLMLGSSEFHYGTKTPYHPTAIFKELGMNVMCIGAAQNQSLSHAITAGAVGPDLKNKKAVLILSPSWFSKKGTDPSGFAARFSESQYMELLQNESLSRETREAVAARVEELLKVSPGAENDANRMKKILFTGKSSAKERIEFKAEKWFNREKENINVGLMWKSAGGKNNSRYVKTSMGTEPDWDALAQQADASIEGKTNNDFHMVDKLYKKKVMPMLKARKGADEGRSYADSPEYGDLKLFLDVCREQNIDVMLVMMPVNGWWYDYTGFSKEKRETFVTGVENIAQEYGVKTCNFFDQCYTPGFLADIVHPAGKGWVRINEEAYKFFKES